MIKKSMMMIVMMVRIIQDIMVDIWVLQQMMKANCISREK